MANLNELWKKGSGTPDSGSIPEGGLGIDTANGAAYSKKADGTIFQIGTPETVTSLSINGNVLTYTDENGNESNIDLSAYLDDTTNTVTSAVLNGSEIDFTREDGTILSVDVSSLYGDYYTKTETENKILELAPETTTELSLDSNTLKFKDETGTITSIDLSAYLDDTNTVTSVNGQIGDVVLEQGSSDATSSTLASLTKTFVANEPVQLPLSSGVVVPVVAATKEIPQLDVTSDIWNVREDNYEFENFAYPTSLTPSSTRDGIFTLGEGSFLEEHVGMTIKGNGGEAVLLSTDGSFVSRETFTDTSSIDSGEWTMEGLQQSDLGVKLSSIPTIDFSNKIQASDPEAQDNFGYSVSCSNTRIVVGAYQEDTNGSNAGSAYIYDIDGNFITKIQASDPEADDRFGWSVSCSNTRIVVGAYQEDTNGSNAGSAYIYDIDGNFIAKIQSSDPQSNDKFGRSVACSDTRIVVGAPYEDTTEDEAGTAYIYDIDGNFIAKIQASDPEDEEYFGHSVACSDTRIVVGIPFKEDINGIETGAAYIYDIDGNFIAKIQASDPGRKDEFGHSVSVSNTRIVVGAYQENTTEDEAGSAYIYDIDGNFIAKIQASDPEDSGNFGNSVSCSDTRIVVGENREDNVYIYDIDGNFIEKIVASDPGNDDFGRSVSCSDTRIVVGAPYEDTTANNAGSVYIYNFTNTNVINQHLVSISPKINTTYWTDINTMSVNETLNNQIVNYALSNDDRSTWSVVKDLKGSRNIVRNNNGTWEYNTSVLYDNETWVQSSVNSEYQAIAESIASSPSNQEFILKEKIQAFDAESGDYFGYSVSISDSRIVIGAKRDDTTTSSSGSAYIYDIDGTFITKIQASDPQSGAYFGHSVSVSDSRIVVGAYYGHTSVNYSGSAYVYDIDGTFITKIQASDPEGWDNFGYSVSCSDTRIVVGAYRKSTTATRDGSAYIYDINGNFISKIQASDPESFDEFGYSVACSDTRIVVGSPDEDTTATRAGSAYIYDINGNFLTKIQASDPDYFATFGYSVSVSDSRIVVGASHKDLNGKDEVGSAYIYDTNGNFIAKILASDPETDDNFGYSVSVSNSRIVVGAYREDTKAFNAGSAYIYDIDGNFITKIQASDPEAGDEFGHSVSVSGTRAVVGIPYKGTAAHEAGSAYIYDYGDVYQNRMSGNDLSEVSNDSQIILGNELHLAQVLYSDTGKETPIADGVTIDYDGNIAHVPAEYGVDYEYKVSGEDLVEFKSLKDVNLKVRIV